MLQRLSGMPKNRFRLSRRAAFYVFCKFPRLNFDALTFATRVLDEASVALIPGGRFWKARLRTLKFLLPAFPRSKKVLNKIKEWLSKQA